MKASPQDNTPVMTGPDTAVTAAEVSTIVFPAEGERLDPERLFGARRPLEIEVGCGKARFLLARARGQPEVSFFGIDRMLTRLEKADRVLQRDGIRNVRLLRVEAWYAFSYLLPEHSVAACYVFFPDPWPKRRHHRRRLFGPAFLDALHRTLAVDGRIHAATDHADYFADILKVFSRDPRFVKETPFAPAPDERTDFELKFLAQGLTIGRASYRKA
jgi:tRNA (guanine-N7-)-methyltransferase